MKFYTWKDIERYILINYNEWKDYIYNIEVYPNEIVVYPKDILNEKCREVLGQLFPKNMFGDKVGLSEYEHKDYV